MINRASRFLRRRYAKAYGIALACLVFGNAHPCRAHQKWLCPNVFAAEKAPVWISFDVTWSDQPFTAERGIGDQPLWVIASDGRREAPRHVFIGKTKSVAEVELKKEGTYCLEAVDPLKYWTQIEKNGTQQWLEKSKDEVTNEKIIRADLYWSKALAYVTVGEPSDLPPPDDADPLCIVLNDHPSQLKVGTESELRVLSFGKPLPDAEIKIFSTDSSGHDPKQTIQCDSQGTAKLKLKLPGRYLLACSVERQVGDDPKADIHSFNMYLTLIIK